MWDCRRKEAPGREKEEEEYWMDGREFSELPEMERLPNCRRLLGLPPLLLFYSTLLNTSTLQHYSLNYFMYSLQILRN